MCRGWTPSRGRKPGHKASAPWPLSQIEHDLLAEPLLIETSPLTCDLEKVGRCDGCNLGHVNVTQLLHAQAGVGHHSGDAGQIFSGQLCVQPQLGEGEPEGRRAERYEAGVMTLLGPILTQINTPEKCLP